MSTCTHCYMQVMFKSDGCCPACGRDQGAAIKLAPEKTMAVIAIGQAMPACCIVCGAATQRTQRFTFWYDIVESKTLFTRLMACLPGNERRKAQRIVLPVCDNCAPSEKTLQPLSIRLDLDFRMIVHRNFQTMFETLNGPAQSEPT